jgi:hypothetical protein
MDGNESVRERRGRSRACLNATYASAAQTRAVLASSQAALSQRLHAADMIDCDEAAELAGVSKATVSSWAVKGRCIGITQASRRYRFPRWQFEPAIWDAMPKISSALGLRGGLALLTFLESPHGGLNGLTPRSAIEQGHVERVLQVALSEGNS